MLKQKNESQIDAFCRTNYLSVAFEMVFTTARLATVLTVVDQMNVLCHRLALDIWY